MRRAPDAAELVHAARVRSGLSQRELARRARTTQSVVARIELGETSPSWTTLTRLLRAAGFRLSAELRRAGHTERKNTNCNNLVTGAGRLDIAFVPAGTTGYEDLATGAEKFEAFGVEFLAASLDDIIRSREATGHAKDQDDLVLLRALRRRR